MATSAPESDGIAETLEGGVTLGATVAARAGEVAVRAREAALRRAVPLEQQRLAALRARVESERAAATAAERTRAGELDALRATATARAARREQAEAVALTAAADAEQAVADRQDTASSEVEKEDTPPVEELLDPTAAAGFDDGYGVGYAHGLDRGRAQLLDELGLTEADVAAGLLVPAASLTPYTEATAAAAATARAELDAHYPPPPGWDAPQRRDALADELRAAGVDEAAIEARVLADTGQAWPPEAAVSGAAGAGRTGQARAADRSPQRVTDLER